MPRAKNAPAAGAKQSRPRRPPGPHPFVPPSLDLEDVLRAVVASAAELSGAALVTIWTANEDARILERQAVSDDRLAREYPFRTQSYGSGGVGWVALHRRPLNVRRVADDVRLIARDWCQARGLTSYLGLPIAFEGALLGVLSLLGRAPFKLGVGERRRLEAFVVQAAAAIRNARHFAASEARRRSAEALAEDNARLYDEARRRQHEAETLARLAQTLTESLDVGDVGRRIVESVLPVFGVRSAGLRLIQPDGSLVTVARSAAAGMHSVPGNVVPPGTGISGRAIADGRPVRTPNLLDDPGIVVTPHMRAQAMASGERAMLAVPLRVKGRIIGSLSVADREGRVFLDADATLLQGFADQAALALENARLYGEAERRRREAELLAQLARSVNESLDLNVVLQRIAGAVQELCHSDIARIAMHDAAAGAMMFRYWAGAAAGDWLGIRFEPGKGLGGQVLLTGRPARTDDYVNDRRFTRDYLQLAVKEGVAAMMCVPIAIAGSIEGLVFAINRGTRTFTDHDEAVLVRLADQAAIAIHNAQLFTREQRARADAEASERALSDSEAQLRTSEERYRALVEHAPDAIVVFDPKSDRFVDVNEQAVRLARLTRAELLQRGLLELSPTHQPDGRSSLEAGRDWIRQALKGAKPTFEWTHLDVGGRLVPCEVSLVRLPDRGRPLIRASIFDITERKRAQETRARLEEELRQAQKMEAVGRLAGGVAHDFNNLLTVIGGRAALIAEKLHWDDPVRRDVELVQKTTERAAALTRQLLAFSRKQLLQPKVLDLNTVVSALTPMLRRLIGEDIDVVTALAPDLGLIRADPAQIDQVIMNLAVNARDAMADGGQLTLSTARLDVDAGPTHGQEAAPPGAYVVLRVADTGIGMDSATLERIFEPFFTTKEVGKGTGLGLSTVYGIVTQSGGFIGVDSAPGRGTVFTIHLPLVLGEEDPAAPGARAGDGPRGRETVLLVEDEPEVRALTRDILGMHGYRVLETAGPAEAEQMCRDHAGPIDALLTDVVMPQMSGRALAARLSPMRPAMRILYMTGYDNEALVGHGGPESGPALLTKPFTPAELAAKLRAVLD